MSDKYILAEFPIHIKTNQKFFCILEEFNTLKDAENFRWSKDEYYGHPLKYCTLPKSHTIEKFCIIDSFVF